MKSIQLLRIYQKLNPEKIHILIRPSSEFTITSLFKPIITPFSMLVIAFTLCCSLNSSASEIYIGKSTADISPTLPVALMGQFNLRIAHTAATPLTANVVALESREGTISLDAAIFVSCDLVYIPTPLLSLIRLEVAKQMPGFDINSLFFWNKEGKLIAMSIDVACPAQEVESRSEVNADYWHPVRTALKKKNIKNLKLFGMKRLLSSPKILKQPINNT